MTMVNSGINDDGLVGLYRFFVELAHNKDVDNAQRGVGMMGFLGMVISGAPDIRVQMQATISLTDEQAVLSQSSGDLLIPANLRLTIGDTIGLVPFNAGRLRWWVMGITRDPVLQPIETARLGYDGDRNPNDPTAQFVGIQVNVPDGDLGNTSTVTVSGQNINITSFGNANVNIDGVNFKNHKHTYSPGAGAATDTGTPH